MNREFQCVNWLPVLTAPNVNVALDMFNVIVKDIFCKHAPIVNKRTKSRPCAWLTEKVKATMNQRNRVLRKARKTNNQADWNEYKNLRNRSNNMQKEAKAAYHKNLRNTNRLNPKKFWKSVKDIFPTKSCRQNNIVNNEKNNKTRAENFREYFATVVYKLKSGAFKLKDCVWKTAKSVPIRTKSVFKFQYVSKVFIKNFLKKLKRNKATGIDDLPAGMLKDCAEHIATPLHHIVNQSLITSTVPTGWKQAKLVPLYKSGDSNKVENYRPISVLPTLSKLMEKAVHTQLTEYLESGKLLNDSQFGYRANRSTSLATTLLVDEIRNAGEKGMLLGALFLDLSKAFDTINHDVILKKLTSYGVNNVELQWFTDYLFNRSQFVVVGNQTSTVFDISSGVPQGSILGPLLFLLFINDFPEQLLRSKCIQYADDTVVYFTDRDASTIEKALNDEIGNLSNYFNDNELITNLKKGKTESMLFGTAKRLSKNNSIQLTMEGQPIQHTNSYTYLGIELDPSLTLNGNFDKAYKKASGRLSLLQKMRSYLNVEAAYNIFEMVIAPLLLYSSLINLMITTTQQKKLLSIEKRANHIIGGRIKIHGTKGRMKKRACTIVKNCLIGKVCNNFKGYFTINEHSINTRNKNKLLKLPKVKLQFGKKSFKFQGAKVYNELPLSIRKCENLEHFKTLLGQHFL